jgi:hypothetical protein
LTVEVVGRTGRAETVVVPVPVPGTYDEIEDLKTLSPKSDVRLTVAADGKAMLVPVPGTEMLDGAMATSKFF